jgi:general secretion pathway protein E
MGIRREPIDRLLVARGVSPSVIERARLQVDTGEGTLVEQVSRTEGADPTLVARTVAESMGLQWLDEIDPEKIDVSLVRKISLGLAREQGVLPLWEVEEDGDIVVAISGSGSLDAVDDLRVLFRRNIQAFVVGPERLREFANLAFDRASQTASAVMEEVAEETGKDDDTLELIDDGDLLDDPNQAPIIRFVNSLFTQAIKDRASDIHIEPFDKELVVRFRTDGVLTEVVKPPPRLQASIVSRIKIMSGLNIAEKRIPQDGRIRTRMAGREIDVRVSTMPVQHGERVVMRLLEKGSVFALEGTGMSETVMRHFRKLIRLPHGIILVCGPTGSGKTTTLYSALSEINSPDKNILTIENPVEYELRGIGQTQVNPKIDLTFASVLRAHLRQDPDIILVGETRDKETAENAIQASLTGHLVFTTIHTNDAPSAFTRIIDMGIEPFLVASSLIAVLAQRLVRRLCPDCKEAYHPSDEELHELSLSREWVAGRPFHRAVGCPECQHKGYRGRCGIHELLVVSEPLRVKCTAGADASVLKKVAIAEGMKTLRDDGLAKVLEGVTSVDEVLRVTSEDAIVLD